MRRSWGHFAVVLNRNAKKVNEKVEELSRELVAPEDLFLSASAEDSRSIAATIIERGYETVFAGGGDGTVMHLINELARFPVERQPAVGILKLGTGNAMARMVSSGNLAGDLKSYIHSATREVIVISLIEVEGRRCPFTGIGFDAEVLNDYVYVKEHLGHGPFSPVAKGLGGYFLAFFGRSLPRTLGRRFRGEKPHLKVTVSSGECECLRHDGTIASSHGQGTVVYDGPVAVAMAGTVPFYGYGLKILPYAGVNPARFHLRVISELPIAKGLANLRKVWVGEYRSRYFHDYLASHVTLSLSSEVPFQIGGDAAGTRNHVTFRVVPNCVRLLKLL